MFTYTLSAYFLDVLCMLNKKFQGFLEKLQNDNLTI